MSRVAFVASLAMLLVACGGGGSSTSVPAPSALSYTSPVQAKMATAMTPLSPTVTGTVASYSVSPALPAGVSLSTKSGTISGTPTATAAQATYTITATNATGSTTFAWVLTVQSDKAIVASQTAIFSDAPVGGLSYSASPSGTTGTTNALGEFNYAPGDSVTFSAAGITLGTATGLSITSTSGSPAVITPINLVAGATSSSNPTVTAIGQFLGGLNSVAVAAGQGTGGLFTVPSATGLSGTQATTVTTLLSTLQSSGTTTTDLSTALSVGGAVQAALASAGGAVPTPASAQANITQGLADARFVGTVWTAPCASCSGGGTITLILNADGVVSGSGKISSSGGGTLIGTWQASTSSSGSVSFTVVSSPDGSAVTIDGSYLAGTVSGSSGSAQIFNASAIAQGASVAFAESPLPTGTTSTYIGDWKLSLDTITAAGHAIGEVGGSDFVIVEPNGITVSGENSSLGTVNLNTGVVTTTGTGNDLPTSCGGGILNPTRLGTVDFATGTFTQSDSNNTLLGSGTLIRAGISAEVLSRFFDNAGTAAEASVEVEIPLSLSVSISWPANTGTATSSLDVGVVLSGPGNVGTTCSTSASTKMEAVGLRPEINPLGSGAAAGTTTDTFSVGYVKGQAQTYQVSVLGPSAQFCSVTQNGSGAVVDANSGNASAYPTVPVVCSQ